MAAAMQIFYLFLILIRPRDGTTSWLPRQTTADFLPGHAAIR
jgi:hypothetical protein